MTYASNEELFPVWREPRSIWERRGFNPRQQRYLTLVMVAITLLLLSGWIYATIHAIETGGVPSIARRISQQPSLLSRNSPAPATFLLEAAINAFTDWEERFRGESGQVRIVVQEPGDTLPLPDSVPSGVEIVYAPVEAVDSMGAIAGSSRAARS